MGIITQNVSRILEEIPAGVTLAAAAKTRSSAEIEEAIKAGVKVIGQNYLQDAETTHDQVSASASWHFIGHLQRRKAKRVVELFDMIETLDSLKLAEEIDKRCGLLEKKMKVLIEVNSGREPQKGGVFPETVPDFLQKVGNFQQIQVVGLMTMGPFSGDPEDARPYFVSTRRLFEQLGQAQISDSRMDILSMGMSNSYRVAIEEGATLIRVGTAIFGPRG